MIQTSIITDAVYKNLIEIFMSKQETDIDRDLLGYIGIMLTQTPQWVVHDSNWQGFLVMYKKGPKIVFNPWLFGGLPVCKGNNSLASQILDEAITICKKLKEDQVRDDSNEMVPLNRIVMILNHNSYLDYKSLIDHSFIYDYDYCDMELDLESIRSQDANVKRKTISSYSKIVSLRDISAVDVKRLYHQAFAVSDAKFYSMQTTKEKVAFFSYLNYDLAIKCDESLGILWHNQFIGFAMVIDSDHETRNINCMCISPMFQNKGFGKLLLDQIIGQSLKKKVKRILLGTETQMKAFNLYRDKGFHVTGTSNYYHYDL